MCEINIRSKPSKVPLNNQNKFYQYSLLKFLNPPPKQIHTHK